MVFCTLEYKLTILNVSSNCKNLFFILYNHLVKPYPIVKMFHQVPSRSAIEVIIILVTPIRVQSLLGICSHNYEGASKKRKSIA